jgi:hypothetical protein
MSKIWPRKSSGGAPILFVPKAHGKGLRTIIDYRGLNNITVLTTYPLQFINELRDRVQVAKLLIKIDLKLGIFLSESALAMNGRQPSELGTGTMSIWQCYLEWLIHLHHFKI